MSGQRHWTVGIAAGTGLLGLTITGGLTVLAHHFVHELSRPHSLLDEALFTWEVPSQTSEPPLACQRLLLFKTVDGKLLAGEFWAQQGTAPTVVLCHGYRVSRSHLRTVAALEYAYGYNVLLFDFRGHGFSESVSTSGGNAEVRDLEAAVVVATRQPETLAGRIIIHGFSMGAAVALLTPPHPDVIAIIADSPYAHSGDILRRIVQYRLAEMSAAWWSPLRLLGHLWPALAWSTVQTSRIIFRLRFGHGVVARPASSFKRYRARPKATRRAPSQHRLIPILLIHADGDPLIPVKHAHQIAAAARLYDIPLETFFSSSSVHCGAYGYDPERYVQVLQAFLARQLAGDFPTTP